MKALTLDAHWIPRADYSATSLELKSQIAVRASGCWKDPMLELSEKPDPQIEADEVLVQVKACGVCGSDTHCCEMDDRGYVLYSGALRAPVILGHEFSGRVVETGKNVSSLKVGDAVAVESMRWCGNCESCRMGHFNQCSELEMAGFTVPGAFAEYISVQAKYCWKLDTLRSVFQEESELYEIGALIEPLGCAYNGLFVAGGGFRPGAHIVVYGAGPIGLSATLLARAAGAAKIIVFDVSEPRNRLALALGADHTANPEELLRRGTLPSAFVRELTAGHGADMQIEAAGAVSMTMPEIQKSSAPNGTMVFMGRQDGHASVKFDPIVSQANRIVGSRGHSGYGIYSHVIRMLATGRTPIRQLITGRFPFGRVIEAVQQSTKRSGGKMMVHFP